ncbi:MAG TPA: hypothetical protein PLT92_14190 [Ignavibacteriaceae bacterium]|nr:hypothetical protein [Ignavibacteriaceae bacterium]
MENLNTNLLKSCVNDELRELYKKYWKSLNAVYEADIDLEKQSANPLLISIANEEEYSHADIRLLIFGQETNGWGTENGEDEIEDICFMYEEKIYGKYPRIGLNSQFWIGFNKFVSMLKNRYPSKKVFPIWNNVIKIGKNDGKGRPSETIYNIERNYFRVIREEVSILQPQITLFLTGPNYDEIIQNIFGEINFIGVPPYTSRQLSRLYLEGVEYTFRTYHPNYLLRNNINNYFTIILEAIKIF